MNGYDLSRAWFDYAFEHSRTVRPIHTAIYFWCLEKANRAGWARELQLPTDEACRALGIKDPKSFRAALDELISWGAIRLVQEAKSQNIARYISLNGCSLTSAGCLNKAIINEGRLSEKRSSDTPSDTPSDTLTRPLNTKQQTLNLKPKTEGQKLPPPPAPKVEAVKAVKTAHREKVTLTEAELSTLVQKHGQPQTDRILDKLSLHKLANGQTYKSDYHAILKWVVGAVAEDDQRSRKGQASTRPAGVVIPPKDALTYSDLMDPARAEAIQNGTISSMHHQNRDDRESQPIPF